MLGNIKQKVSLARQQAGFTVTELTIAIAIASMLILSFVTVSLYMYGDTVRSTLYAQLATESQNILRSVVEELRQSSSIRSSNANPDPNAPGGTWSTSNSSLILIISTPALDGSNNFIMNSDTGYPYQNEIVYFVSGNTLYKRTLVDTNAAGNAEKRSCPISLQTASCPADIVMSRNFSDMNFVFYDQDDAITTNIPNARSIKLILQMQRQSFGKTLHFDNTIRITIRNTSS